MSPRHPLDRPVWSALSTRQAAFGVGDERARRYAPDVAPFAAARFDTKADLQALGALVAAHGPAMLIQAGEAPPPPDVVAEKAAAGVQMVLEQLVRPRGCGSFEPLSEADAPEMLALAALTRPGPFLTRTHRLGEFIGVRVDGRLAAMAGERMKPEGYAEVSGVCTHPDHRGRGYASLLSYAVAERILRRGETPFLHAWADNAAAIVLYGQLGFALRTEVTVRVLAPR